ncbi:hypothetical protein PV10_05977 [Exophiala mesophila]|uniref:N-acetyltransferase domain-containing protein n=1 Tax=Exophiala mesophila TaxID=212818 RepID=A0A0D1XTF8_EXOME|nr:uncharacterized protein PV10_05977 [Exophiala mesophila]KIV91436.1 hypothetical protein PV10_05977 [Exophiala mesophila]
MDQFYFTDLRRLPKTQVLKVLTQIQQMERKIFPENELTPLDDKISKKPNTEILVVLSQSDGNECLIAYAIAVRCQHRLLLHKICVSAAYRSSGLGTRLLKLVIERAHKTACRTIDLWAHADNHHARRLYSGNGFQILQTVTNYYSHGNDGVKMSYLVQP